MAVILIDEEEEVEARSERPLMCPACSGMLPAHWSGCSFGDVEQFAGPFLSEGVPAVVDGENDDQFNDADGDWAVNLRRT